MRLLFLNRFVHPDPEPTGQLLGELCAELARAHDVSVIAGPGYAIAHASRRLFRQESFASVSVVRTWGTMLPKSTLADRLTNLASYYCLAALAAVRMPRQDAVVAETDPPLLGVLGALLKSWWRCRFIYYCQDLYPDIAVATGGLRNRFVLRFLDLANRFAYSRADCIVVLGRDMRDRLIAKGVPPKKIAIVPNWVDCAAVLAPEVNGFRNRFGDKFVVMYSGNLGLSQELEVILKAAEDLQDDSRIVFAVIGSGAQKASLEQKAREVGLTNLRFLPAQPKERLGESLSAADVHLIPLREGVAGCLVPSKVYGVLGAGRPFIAMMEESAEVAMIAREHRVGFVTPPGDAASLARVIERAITIPDELRAMGMRARKLAEEKFDRGHAVRQFAQLIDDVESSTRGCETAGQQNSMSA